MNRYQNLPEQIQDRIDNSVQSNVKDYILLHLQVELAQHHKKRIRQLIHDYYNHWKEKHGFFISYRMIEEDILMWLNHPFTKNMDNPFMFGKTTKRFKNVMKRVFSSHITTETQYQTTTKHLTGHEIVNIILEALTVEELENFYTYNMRWIGECKQKNVIQVPLREHLYA